MNNDVNDVYKVEEVQQILRISRKTAYELMKDPPFPVCKVINQYRISKVGFDSWLLNQSSDFVVSVQ